MTKEALVQIRGMRKTFGPTIALKKVDIDFYPGEVRGLIGENGSGKSTVTSIMAGMQKADEGTMTYKGESWNPKSMNWALEQGVGMIVQECGTVPGITVAENIFLGDMNQFRTFKLFVNRAKMFKTAQQALDDIGAGHIKATQITASLDMMDRKLVEVAKVWMKRPEILVVDETTTSLSQKGRDIIYDIMNRMREANKCVVFISHDLDEIMEKCDTLTVLRDGDIIRTFDKSEFDPDEIRTSMIGRELQGDYYRSDWDGSHGENVAIKLENVCLGKRINNINLDIHEGEILGIGGLSECGMHEVGKLIYGAIKPTEGKISVNGTQIKNPSQAMKLGLGYVAKDRDVESLCTDASIKDNIAIAGLDRFAVAKHFIFSRNEKKYVNAQSDFMKVKCYSTNQLVTQLSGGNKQKVVFAKWIGRDSRILILDCPTRGIDIGVKQTMYQLMYKMKKEGRTIILISEEMSELMGMADRLVIMKNGAISKEFPRSADLSDAEIIKYMI